MPPTVKKASSVERLQRRKTDMAQYASIVAMISLPPSQRADETVDVTAHWLQRKSQLLQEVELAVVRDVARHCDYLCAEAGQPIVRQGDIGDAFYVILEGQVSVYVRDDDDVADDDGEAEAQGENDGADGEMQPPHRRDQQHAHHHHQHHHHDHDQQSGAKAASLQSHRGKGAAAKHAPTTAVAPPPRASSSLPQPLPLGAAGESDVRLDGDAERAGEGEDGSTHAPPPPPLNYGNKVAAFGTGGSFGELALISDDSVRAASVVAEVRTDLLVVHRELYNRSIKAYQERDLREARRFVESHRFFRGWPARQLHQVVVSLRRLKLTAGECAARQGAAVDGLHFLRTGKALVTFQPRRHRDQYVSSVDLALYDAVAAAVAKENEPQSHGTLLASSSWPSLTTAYDEDGGDGSGAMTLMAASLGHALPAAADAVSRHKLKHLTAEHLQERRLEGYAAAERRHLRRHHDLCLVSDGEVIGDVEHSLALPTYMMTVRAVDDTSFYHLDAASVERLLGAAAGRRHGGAGATTLPAHVESANADIRDSAMIKWSLRGDLYHGAAAEIPLLRYVTDALRRLQALRPDTRGGRTRTATASAAATSALLRRRGRELPRGDALFRHMLDAYAVDRAELVQPYVPGAVYYKELMKDRARQRQVTRRLEQAAAAAANGGGGERGADVGMNDAGTGGVVLLPSTLRKRMEVRQPRSISVLKSVIKTLQTSDVDTIIPRRATMAPPPPPPPPVALAQAAVAAASTDLATAVVQSPAVTAAARIPIALAPAPSLAEQEVIVTPPSLPAPASPSRASVVDAVRPRSAGRDGLGVATDAAASAAAGDGEPPATLVSARERGEAAADRRRASTEDLPTDAATAAAVVAPEVVQQSDHRSTDPATTGVTAWRNHAVMRSVILEDAPYEEAAAQGADETEVTSITAAARATGRGGGGAARRVRGCRADNMELAEGQVLKFFSPYLRGKLSKLYEDFENPEIRRCNRETSILEKRILQFYGSSLAPSPQKDSGGAATHDGSGGDISAGGDSLSPSATAAATAAGLLTRLNRLEALNAVVKPGGRCVVKKSVCRLLNCEFQLKSHKHTRYHIVGAMEDTPSKTAR